MKSNILKLEGQEAYELIDSGEGEKLERFGEVVLRRPDPQALWLKSAPEEWDTADATYSRTGPKSGEWKAAKQLPESWTIPFGGLQMNIKLSSFKHTGLFPEQASNWSWLREVIKESGREINVLNLFGYTGGASLACAEAGAKVTHVDSSKTAITWANENAASSGLKEKPIRWILEDAYSFVNKELRRGKTYDGIIMDPPSFGHGTEGEVWKIEKQFTDFIEDCNQLLSDNPAFYLINGYAAGYSSITYANNLLAVQSKFGGEIEHGELTIEETKGKRPLPAGIFARWRK
jgi:23S rRNA (cytosine1962-C5)-methyltransferase